MALPKKYDPKEAEPRLAAAWQANSVYTFDLEDNHSVVGPVYSIDTPPPTVSGHLHLGHVYSYSHTDFIARYQRMRGRRVFYPMGFDDNGLPTERLVEKRLGITAREVGRQAFIEKCLEISAQAEADYRRLWQRLGLSIDWRYTYRTIDEYSRRTSQRSFIELYRLGRIYRQQAPAIWCPECRTALAQADLDDLERESEFVTLRFPLLPPAEGMAKDNTARPDLLIATTRPELLPACVAIFIHPDDRRYQPLIGRTAITPLTGQPVPILADPAADPEKGTGAVMCCTFGDAADVDWQRQHALPIVSAIGPDGRMTAAAGEYAGLTTAEARQRIKIDLEAGGWLLERSRTQQTIRVHERCDTPVETIVAPQWFVRVLDAKAELLAAGEQVDWHPTHMQARYRAWVENLNWDWCLSRQRFYGVPFPVWYCNACGEPMLADEADLPVDPLAQSPGRPCACGGSKFTPDPDVMDTWATSSLSPQIVGRWLASDGEPDRDRPYAQVFPFSLRPQAHEIIRTWAFYTLVKSTYHFGALPWQNVMISGWGIAGEGMGKISKSRGGGPMAPLEMIERYSADALRYWAASTATGKDAVISEDKIRAGAKLVTKLWNVAGFVERFIADLAPIGTELRAGPPDEHTGSPPHDDSRAGPRLTPADVWILARLQSVIRQATLSFDSYDYAGAKNTIETFFWRDLADNYLEMCKLRLYDPAHPQRDGALYALQRVLLDTLKLLAPLLPYVTDEIYRQMFAAGEKDSIHSARWPQLDPHFADPQAEALGERLVEIASAVRRYKSERSLPLGSEISCLQVHLERRNGDTLRLFRDLAAAIPDLQGITRARCIQIAPDNPPIAGAIPAGENLSIWIQEHA